MLGAITIDPRFNGPPGSGNGGYVCGRLADAIGATVATVRLRRPVPLDVPLRVQATAGGVELVGEDGGVVAIARHGAELPEVPALRPDAAALAAAQSRCISFNEHPLPRCFVCGPRRARGDGLRIFVGRLEDVEMNAPTLSSFAAPQGGAQCGPAGTEIWAAPWRPDATLAASDGRVGAEFLWAALDCPGAFVHTDGNQANLLLGELAAEVAARPGVDEACSVLAWSLGGDGRKRFSGTALFGSDGSLLARARATWVEVAF